MSKCKKCNDKGWYFVDEYIGSLQGRKDCSCKIRYADMTLDECRNILNKILDNHYLSWIPISEIPSVLLDDFTNFNIGNTMSMVDGVECVSYRDFKNFYIKLMNGKGFDYQIKWKTDEN